jgi:hypothetical protein
MLDPFKVFGRLLLASFKISGYFVVCIGQVLWYAACRKPDKIGDAFGYLGRGTVDALAGVFK